MTNEELRMLANKVKLDYAPNRPAYLLAEATLKLLEANEIYREAIQGCVDFYGDTACKEAFAKADEVMK